MKLTLPVNERYSSPATVSPGATIKATVDAVIEFQGSANGLYWQSVHGTRSLVANVGLPIPRTLHNYAKFRIVADPQPIHREFTLSAAAATDEDLVVPDVIKTRSTTIERDEAGLINKVKKTGGREITINRDVNGNIEDIDDETHTWTVARDEDGNIEEVAVT